MSERNEQQGPGGDGSDVSAFLRQWDEDQVVATYDPVPLLTQLSELIEKETEAYMKMDPDPFDERHPSRAYPNCTLGHTLKIMFRKEAFMTKLVNDYLRDNYYTRLGISGRDVRKLNIAACRLMLNVTPGLETTAVFEMPTNDSLVQRLFSWAEKSIEPLQTYATGLLAAAMEVQEIAVVFREQNLRLIPLMLERLHSLQAEFLEEKSQPSNSRPFAHLGSESNVCNSTPNNTPLKSDEGKSSSTEKQDMMSPIHENETTIEKAQTPRLNGSVKRDREGNPILSKSVEGSSGGKERRLSVDGLASPPKSSFLVSDCSNSSWVEMETYVIGHVQMFPLTLQTKQMFILKYLTPMGEYQEFLGHIFEKKALELILQFINLRETKHARLSFEALKYLAALLCHKKFSIEFINMNGLQKLLEVPRPSIAATGVSICLYYLAYCEDAVERVCLLPQHILTDLVKYSLWLLECSHDSGRCHATMFFGLSFQFRVILEEFDAQDGLRKLFNVISTLSILSTDEPSMNEDEECSARQIVRHVCVALKRYLEAHLNIRAEQVRRAHFRDSTEMSKLRKTLPSYKAYRSSPEEVREQITTLLEYMSFRAQWPPVDNFLRLGGVTLLLKIIAFAYDWNYSGRGETVRSALDSLCICAVMPRTQLQLAEKFNLPDETNTVGIHVILGAADGEIITDPDVQKAALYVLITCVCAPINRVNGALARYSSGGSTKKKTHALKSSEEVITKIWDCVRTTNGIMVLLNLIMVKMPITDADSIRALACQALAGLARSETVRQIISKLPLFTSGQLQSLMRDPILQDKRQEHVKFQKYALDLLEKISGKSKPINEVEPSLTNIHKASVVAQTRIQFNDKELLQLIQGHLASHGLSESAAALQKEAGLPPLKLPTPSISFPSPFSYQRMSTTPRGSRLMASKSNINEASSPLTPKTQFNSPQLPIKLCIAPSSSQAGGSMSRKLESRFCSTPTSNRSLEKQITYEKMGAPASLAPKPPKEQPTITLDSIITEYLTNQHALCKNPMATCPQFNLFQPHKCPDPKHRNTIPLNFATRYQRGQKCLRYDQRLIHSRFCCVHTFRYGDDNAFFTCCDFFSQDKFLVIGSHQGEVKMFNLHSGVEVASHHCHESYIAHLQASTKGDLLLTSSTWRTPLSSCWSITNNVFQKMFSMDEEDYVEFSKITEDKIIGTNAETATIYDVATGKLITTLKPTLSNQYNKNRATFSPTNELVLSDGVLWDVNSGREIHKLDKLNQTLSGVFHPNGLEVISNTEVWDLRTFHLLRTVPSLDQCDVRFSPPGDTIYSVTIEKETEDESSFESSFKTFDAYDYSAIATIDVKKNIYDLACNRRDTQIALVENQGMFDSIQESIVKIYDVGRSRINDDEPEEEEEEDDEMEGSDGSGSDDDQLNDSLPLDILDDNSTSSHSEEGDNDNNSESGENDEDDDDDDDDDDNGGADFDDNDGDDSVDMEFFGYATSDTSAEL